MVGVTVPLFPWACGCCAPGYTDTCFPFPFLLVTLTDAMRSMDVLACHVSTSRDFSSFTSMFPVSVSCDSYCTSGLRYIRMSPERFVSPDSVTPICCPNDLSHRFSLRPVLYPSFRLHFTYPTGRYSCLVLLRFLRLFVLVSYWLVYILGWRWDDPHLQSTLQPP